MEGRKTRERKIDRKEGWKQVSKKRDRARKTEKPKKEKKNE
jgi:hypothetical protein